MAKEKSIMRSLVLIGAIALLTVVQLPMSSPALALLREHHQSPGVLRYHAQHSIKDRSSRAWQVILFPDDSESTLTKYYLRLVGFPGLVEVLHPQSLELITSNGEVLTAPDVFPKASPALNVGQYDLSDLVSLLPSNGSLKLVFAASDSQQHTENISLKITPSILNEWQILIGK